MLEIIKKLYPMNRALVSGGEDKAIEIISKMLPLKVTRIATGSKCFTWQVPEKWEVKGATLIDQTTGKLILDYKDNPLYLYVGSLPFEGVVDFRQLEKHLIYRPALSRNRGAVPYVYKYYGLDWGFCLNHDQYKKLNRKHKYKVSIRTKYEKGSLKIGEAVLKGRTSDEIIVIAHVDHPYQANDNLSGVSVAIELFKEIKRQKLNHTLRLLFLPESIGSIAYMWKRRKSFVNIKAVFALDVLGNKNRFLIQRTFNEGHFLNYLCESSCKSLSLKFEMAGFRELIGSDELIFSDPKFGIPSVMISTWPYSQYHTNLDTPDIIDGETLNKAKELVLKIVKDFDRNFVPERKWIGPLMRIKISWFMGKKPEDTHLELFGYKIDGKKSVIEIAQELGMNVDLALDYAHDLKRKNFLK